jgi:hypothetical protein
MRIDRLVVAATAIVASTVLISCGSDDDSNSPGDSVSISTPALDTAVSGDTTADTMVVDTTTP